MKYYEAEERLTLVQYTEGIYIPYRLHNIW